MRKTVKFVLALLLILFAAAAAYPIELWVEVINDGPWNLVVGRLYQSQPDMSFNETGTQHVGPFNLEAYMGNIYAIAQRTKPPVPSIMTVSIIIYTEDGAHIMSSSTFEEIVTIGYTIKTDIFGPRFKEPEIAPGQQNGDEDLDKKPKQKPDPRTFIALH